MALQFKDYVVRLSSEGKVTVLKNTPVRQYEDGSNRYVAVLDDVSANDTDQVTLKLHAWNADGESLADEQLFVGSTLTEDYLGDNGEVLIASGSKVFILELQAGLLAVEGKMTSSIVAYKVVGEAEMKVWASAKFIRFIESIPQASGDYEPTMTYDQLVEAVASKSDQGHVHDDRYYNEAEMDTLLDAKSDVGHTHEVSDVTNLESIITSEVESAVDSVMGDNYYTKVEVDTKLEEIDLTDYPTKAEMNEELVGKADLVNGVIPSSQLPGSYDDVKEYANLGEFPYAGESNAIYLAKDTNLAYRWSGSSYVEISPSLALGETASTAYSGAKGKVAYDHAQLTESNPHYTSFAQLEGLPTTLSGFGITDALGKDSVNPQTVAGEITFEKDITFEGAITQVEGPTYAEDDSVAFNNLVFDGENNSGNINDLLTVSKTNKTKWLDISTLLKRITEYGARKVVGQSSPTWERVMRVNGQLLVGSATGLTSEAGIGTEVKFSSFDHIPIFQRDKINDANDNVFVRVKKYYIKEEFVTQNSINYEYLWMSETKLPGYRTPPSFIDPSTGIERDYFYLGAYEGAIDGTGKLVSKSGLLPTTSQTRSTFRTAARKNDGSGANTNSQYQLLDIAAYNDLILVPFLIEFATTNSQTVSQGFTAGRYTATDTVLYSATGVNAFVVSSTVGGYFRIGQTVAIGTSLGGTNVVGFRTILSIQTNTPTTGEATITVDGNPFNVSVGNVLWNFAWKTGSTDGLGSSTATLTANTGHYPFIWRGLENPFGNIWKFVDGVKISNNVTWVSTDPSRYDDISSNGGNYASPYALVGYTNSTSNGFLSGIGYDANYPYARHPTGVIGSSTTYYSDYYYQSTGDRTVLVGGWYGSSAAGLFFWDLSNSLTNADVHLGSRLSKKP